MAPILIVVTAGCTAVFAGEPSVSANATPPVPLVVEAHVIETTAIPTLAAIAPYESALIVNTYRVLGVVSGELTDDTIAVAHWAIQKKRTLEVPVEEDRVFRLTLKPFQTLRELQGEKLVDATEGFDLLLFFAMEYRPAGGKIVPGKG